jgi:hypothetical protein
MFSATLRQSEIATRNDIQLGFSIQEIRRRKNWPPPIPVFLPIFDRFLNRNHPPPIVIV